MLEKTEHYERDVQVQKDGLKSNNLKDNFDDFGRKFDAEDFEFYYEKNVRP